MGLCIRIYKMKDEYEFVAWIYENYLIANRDTLLEYMEDGDTYNLFLEDMGLTDA